MEVTLKFQDLNFPKENSKKKNQQETEETEEREKNQVVRSPLVFRVFETIFNGRSFLRFPRHSAAISASEILSNLFSSSSSPSAPQIDHFVMKGGSQYKKTSWKQVC